MRTSLLLILFILGFLSKIHAQKISIDSLESTEKDTFIPDSSLLSNKFTYILYGSDSTALASADTIQVAREYARPRKPLNSAPAWYLYFFLGGFLLLSIVQLAEPTYLKELFASALNTDKLMTLFQEGRFGFNFINLNLDVVFILAFSTLVNSHFYKEKPEVFIWVIVFTVGAYFMKIILIQLMAYLFFDRLDALLHVLMYLLFTRLAGIVLLPLVFFNIYQSLLPGGRITELILFLLVLLYAVWIVKLLVKMKVEGVSGIFYLFLYLCAIEISPVLILIKNLIL